MHDHTDARTNDLATHLTIPQVAVRLGVSTDTVRRYIKAGELPAVMFARKYRVTPEDVDALFRRFGRAA